MATDLSLGLDDRAVAAYRARKKQSQDEGDDENGPGLAESVARGAGQGITLGFKDELTAALESALTAKTYRESLAESRANDEAARKAHPWGFGLGQVLGSAAIPGVGEASGLIEGTGLAANAARGAVAGGAAGLGNSTADLAGGDVAGAAKDTVMGGLMGAGIGAALGTGASKLAEGAEARSAARAAETAPEETEAAGGLLPKNMFDAGLLLHHPVAYAAKKVGGKIAGAAGRGADELLAKISRAARAGEPAGQAIKDAIEAGIPRAAIASAVAAGQ